MMSLEGRDDGWGRAGLLRAAGCCLGGGGGGAVDEREEMGSAKGFEWAVLEGMAGKDY
jgi:hypothetical protein